MGTSSSALTVSSSGPGSSSLLGPPTALSELANGPGNMLDAVPDGTGANVYVTSLTDTGAVVFTVPNAAGGSPSILLAEGVLSAPTGLAVSSDGATLYIADTASETCPDGGCIFTLPASGGSAQVMAGTGGLFPKGVDVAVEDNVDFLFFSGVAANGEAAVFKMSSQGGAPVVLAQGAPLVDPSGVAALDNNGGMAVLDTLGGPSGLAQVFTMGSGTGPQALGPELLVGYPAGIATGETAGTWRVSALDLTSLAGVVLDLDAAGTLTPLEFSRSPTSQEPSGLHRAKRAGVTAWVLGTTSDGTGRVLVLQ